MILPRPPIGGDTAVSAADVANDANQVLSCATSPPRRPDVVSLGARPPPLRRPNGGVGRRERVGARERGGRRQGACHWRTGSDNYTPGG